MTEIYTRNIEQNIESPVEIPSASNVAGITLELGALAMRFARIERVPRYEDGRRESDVEHSFMLSLVAPELAKLIDPTLSLSLVHQYATVHDLIELKTGDVPTFQLSDAELKLKEIDEQNALEELLSELPPYNRGLVGAYECQIDRESRFVRAVDKLLPLIVDIYGDGDRIMREDYNVTTHDQLRTSHEKLHAKISTRFEEFPEIVEAHLSLCELYDLETKLA